LTFTPEQADQAAAATAAAETAAAAAAANGDAEVTTAAMASIYTDIFNRHNSYRATPGRAPGVE
jgi:hypothetical protein